MGRKSLLILTVLLSLLTFNAWATTFKPIPLEKLIEESNSAAEVELKSKKSFMNAMGLIFTEYTFSISDSYNLPTSELDGEFLKLTMTGGTFNDVTSYIDGAPEFALGEKSFLLLRKVDSKLYLSNFTMGKYKIEEADGKTYYVSSVFPTDPDLGKVAKERMIELVKLKFKTSESELIPQSTKEIKPMFKRVQAKEETDRRPAQDCSSSDCIEEPKTPEGVIAFWAFLALFLGTSFVIWWKLRKRLND